MSEVTKMKNDDLKDLTVDAFLDMNPNEVAEFEGYKPAPEAVYQGTTSLEAKMNDDETKLILSITVEEPTVVEFIKGAEGESPDELTEDDVPAKLVYSYMLPDRGQNFKTDWDSIVTELNNGEPVDNFRAAIELLDGVAIQFTNQLYKYKVKQGQNAGQERIAQNIKQISLLEV